MYKLCVYEINDDLENIENFELGLRALLTRDPLLSGWRLLHPAKSRPEQRREQKAEQYIISAAVGEAPVGPGALGQLWVKHQFTSVHQ